MAKYEQPDYSVVASGPDYEVRLYETHLVAETSVRGSFESTGNVAFRRLAGYIFGRNSTGTKMNMTVPVTHLPGADGTHRYRFVLERAYTEDSLPRPVEGTVGVARVPGGHYAAAGYRGGRGERRYRKAESSLLSAIERDGIRVRGTPEAAVYDGPFVPAPLRRNEVLVAIDWPPDGADTHS